MIHKITCKFNVYTLINITHTHTPTRNYIMIYTFLTLSINLGVTTNFPFLRTHTEHNRLYYMYINK